jgi:hypothetical protein
MKENKKIILEKEKEYSNLKMVFTSMEILLMVNQKEKENWYMKLNI